MRFARVSFYQLVRITMLAFAVSACDDAIPAGGALVEAAPREPGINAYLSVDRPDAGVGEVVRLDARLAVVETDVTVSGFVATLTYDPTRVDVIDEIAVDDGAMRVGNLAAGPGLARFAGASSDGLASDVLFSIRVRPRAADYLKGLTLTLDELNTLENGFAERSSEARVGRSVYLTPR